MRVFSPKKGMIAGYNYHIGESIDANYLDSKAKDIIDKYEGISNISDKYFTVFGDDSSVRYTIISRTNNRDTNIYIKSIKEKDNTVLIVVTNPQQKKGVTADWIVYPTVSITFDRKPKDVRVEYEDGTVIPKIDT